jgi:hypothetical protein
MEDRLTNQEIAQAIDELAGALGVKEEPALVEYQAMLRSENVEACVAAIAQQLGLPIIVHLSHVGDGTEEAFVSRGLGKTDERGRGIEGITAQVTIPARLPLYGSSALTGLPIKVKVGKGLAAFPETFVALMAHELTHILLYSLRHPKKDDEWFTDLTAMVLGFSSIMDLGRRVIEKTHDGTLTTTYGYFTDREFAFALSTINETRARCRNIKANLFGQIAECKQRLKETDCLLSRFRLYMEYLDTHTNKKIKARAAQRVVACHSPFYLDKITHTLGQCKDLVERTENLFKPTTHYTKDCLHSLEVLTRELQGKTDDLIEDMRPISSDVNLIRRHVGLVARFRLAIKEKRMRQK